MATTVRVGSSQVFNFESWVISSLRASFTETGTFRSIYFNTP